MLRRVVPGMVLVMVGLVGMASIYAVQARPQSVVAHEWGTFTTVANEAGQAMNWTPLGGPTDLPCFVEHYKNVLFKTGLNPEAELPIDYEAARSALVGKVRMETPVIYFYSPADATVSVRVRFPQGLITEWYPTAVAKQANVVPSLLADPAMVGGVDWPSVRIAPNGASAFPTGSGNSHYYAARDTDASPIWVNGQTEKFLFYRGVASFPVPISAALGTDGSVQVTNLGEDPIPAVILFDNRGGTVRYRLHGALESSARLEPPTATADVASLRAVLVRVLKDAGLYEREAEAMVATWRDSWFEEGMRVFYVLPSRSVDTILPLTITPAPTATARAFVGRMELITPAALVQVQMALATNDVGALERHGRFLGPIADRLAARLTSVSDRSRIRAVTNKVFANYVARFGGCQ